MVVVVSKAGGKGFSLDSPPRPNSSFHREEGRSRKGEQGPDEWL